MKKRRCLELVCRFTNWLDCTFYAVFTFAELSFFPNGLVRVRLDIPFFIENILCIPDLPVPLIHVLWRKFVRFYEVLHF